MSKTKRISVNTLERVEKDTYTPYRTLDWHGTEVTITHTLSLKDMLEFVSGVVKSCFTVDNAYTPEIMDFAIKVSVLEKYANFTMPRNIEMQYDMVYHTDAVECVLEHINLMQYREICDSICLKVDNMAQANINAANQKLTEVCAAFDKLQSDIAKMFGGINPGDIKAITDAVANGAFDEHKLVNAYMQLSKKDDQ